MLDELIRIFAPLLATGAILGLAAFILTAILDAPNAVKSEETGE